MRCGLQMSEVNAISSTSGDAEAVEAELLATFRRSLGRPDFEACDGFLDSGGDSLTVIETILHIEKSYGVTLSAAEFMALDTAQSLARHIVSRMHEHEPGPHAEHEAVTRQHTMLSVVQEGERPHPLVCAYGLHGAAAYAIPLAGMLPSDQPVAALQNRTIRVLGDGKPSFRETERNTARSILNEYADRPCALLGFSLGAHVALAVGHELAECGSPPALIVVLDDEADLDRRQFGVLQQDIDPANIADANGYIAKCSPAEPIATRLVYFRSTDNDAYYRSDPTSGWGEIATGGVRYFDVSASHHEIVQECGLHQIASRLSEEIAAPCQNAPRPGEAQILRFEARRASREGNLAKELECLNRVIEKDKEQPAWLYANLAEALFQKGETSAALSALSKARFQEKWQLTLDLRFLGEIKRRGLKAEREELLRRLSAVASDHPSVHEQKALAYFEFDHLKECQLELSAGLAMQPWHPGLSRLLVRYLRRIKDWPELIHVTERLVEHFPNAAVFRTALIAAYTEIGSPYHAVRFHDAIVSKVRPDFDELIALGNAMFRCGCIAAALEVAELAARTQPSRPGAQFLRAECLDGLGLLAEAAAARKHANDM